jgi:uncharacterized protein YceH (UPF0502 family)
VGEVTHAAAQLHQRVHALEAENAALRARIESVVQRKSETTTMAPQ